MPRKAAVHVEGPIRLVQRGRYWYAHYTDDAGQRQRQSLKVSNLRVAQKKAREIADLVERGDYVTIQDRRKQRRSTFAEFVAEFRQKHKGWSESTWRGTESILKRVVEEWGEVPLSGLNTRLIEGFLTTRLDQDGITKATHNRHLACLKTIFKMAVRWGALAHNPAAPIRSLKEDPTIPRALSDSETAKLLSELPDHARRTAIVALDTGMRKSELFGLQWQDIDFERRQVTVRQSKNGSFRVIPMTDRVLEELRKQQQTGVIPYVLPSALRSGQRAETVKDALSSAGHRAGIGHVHLHVLRHTFATRLREAGQPLDRIMALLGHKTMAMSLRYAKSTPTQLKEAIEALG